MNHTIYIRDYVTLPCTDAADGIRRALEAAHTEGADEIRFEAGTYPLRSTITLMTDRATHDAGSPEQSSKEVHIHVADLHGVTLTGVIGADGEPATVLAGANDGSINTMLPSILWCERCSDLTVKDLAFTRDPEYASAGIVRTVSSEGITVEVFPGNPIAGEMGTHCINRFTPDGKTLVGESISYGPGLGTRFHMLSDRILDLKDATIAKRVAVGDVLSWHQGAQTDFQVYFGEIERLSLDNLRTYNSNGFAMLAYVVRDLTARRVVFRPRGNQVFTAPRDAWKLHRCGGRIEISEMSVEGVRMDGQNVHNNYFFVVSHSSPDVIEIETENALPPFRTGEDGELTFFSESTERKLGFARLKEWEVINRYKRGKSNLWRCRFLLTGPLDFELPPDTIGLAECFAPTSYIMRNSSFRNVAGAGNLLRTNHVLIENCTYENMMNPGVMIGAEYPTFHEGGNCSDVHVTGCTFRKCGFTPRYGSFGCIGIRSRGFHTAVNEDITIDHCVFLESDTGVSIATAKNVTVSDCDFSGVRTQIWLLE